MEPVAKLFLLFTLVPLVELWLLLTVGSYIGFWPTVGMAVGTALLGAALAKHEGRRVLTGWRDALAAGKIPDEGVTGGVLVLLGAALLITPGVLTDLTGLLLLFPPTRRRIAALVRARLERQALTGMAGSRTGAASGAGWQVRVMHFGASFPGASHPAEPPRRPRGDVIDVEPDRVEEIDAPLAHGEAGPRRRLLH
ncbi:MAG TPA: FxsA family protein [Bacilli bacterium]|nr:FxsA family protein [Bacilli bacterium]